MKVLIAGMALLAVVFGAGSGRMEAVNAAALEDGGKAVSLVIALTGSLCFWSGLMEVAKQAGITRWIARLLGPVTQRLFPAAAEDPDTLGVISLNMTANLLGLGNAATPQGMEAMRLMEEERKKAPCVEHDMYMLLILNATSIQLIPTTVLALRAAAGSVDAGAIVLPSLVCTAVSTAVGAVLGLICRRRREARRA